MNVYQPSGFALYGSAARSDAEKNHHATADHGKQAGMRFRHLWSEVDIV